VPVALFAFVIVIGGAVWTAIEIRYARRLVRRNLESQGWTLSVAHWRPTLFSRRISFDVEVVRRSGDKIRQGTAMVGSRWWSVFMLRRVEYEWDSGETTITGSTA